MVKEAIFLEKIHTYAKQGRIFVTHKAFREISNLDLVLDEDDLCNILKDLTITDFFEKKISIITKEWMYIFKIYISDIFIYLKIIIREDLIIISFHEDNIHE